MIGMNLDSLVETCVAGTIAHPNHFGSGGPLFVGYDGTPSVGIVQAGITLNVRLGDSALQPIWGERVMPAVAIRNQDPAANPALFLLACVGNEACVIRAALDGKDCRLRGQTGVVIGKDPTLGVVNVYFPKRVLNRLCVGDQIQVRAVGQGISFSDYPDVTVSNCSPGLLKAMNPTEKGGRIRVYVTTILPGKLMAPAAGQEGLPLVGCEIQSVSDRVVREYKLDRLRLGDLVAVSDFDATYGPRWHSGAVTIGTISHGASRLSGRGPGITVLLSSPDGRIEPVISRKAQLKDLLDLG